jgi:hypothetical protein
MNISSEQFTAAYDKLPVIIREYLAGNELGTIVTSVGNNYGLHVDTIGGLDREVSNMLLGFENPQQFVGELKSIGIPEQMIPLIIKEMNEKVFIPLHTKMMQPASEEDGDESPDPEELYERANSTSETAVPFSAVAPTTSSYTPPVASVTPVFVQTPAYVPLPVQPVPPQAPSVSQYAGNTAFPAVPVVPTSAQIPPTQFPAQQYAQVPQPSVSSFPQPIPQQPPVYAAPQVSVPVSAPAPVPTPTPQNPNRDALHDILKQYGVDPYRETPD